MTNEQKYKTPSKQETIADIVAEMRGPYYKMGRSNASLDKDMMGYMSFMANRIEAAHQREVAELRKGISELLDALQAIYDEECTSYGTGEVYDKWRGTQVLRVSMGADDV